jgi:hypothetical protein
MICEEKARRRVPSLPDADDRRRRPRGERARCGPGLRG